MLLSLTVNMRAYFYVDSAAGNCSVDAFPCGFYGVGCFGSDGEWCFAAWLSQW